MRRLILLVLLLSCPVLADVPATVAAVTDSGDMVLSDGRALHLAGIHAATGAAARLRELTKDAPLALADITADRYGGIAAMGTVTAPKPVWLQGALLQDGLAFVMPPAGDDPPRLTEMLAAEHAARLDHRGIWADPAYADLTPEQAKAHQGEFAFVAGTVVDAVKLKDRAYLNFSADWHHDFTAVIAAHDMRDLIKAGLDPLALKGKTIRLRGWITRDFRPLMTVSRPAQIEIIASPARPPSP